LKYSTENQLINTGLDFGHTFDARQRVGYNSRFAQALK